MQELCRSNPVTVKDSSHFFGSISGMWNGEIDNIRYSGAKMCSR